MKGAALLIGAALAAGAMWWRTRSPMLNSANDVTLIDPVISIPEPILNFLDDIGMSSKPRGIRNNNPGNIRDNGTAWQGKIGSDGAFVIFDTPENGIRAMARVLMSYQSRGIDTVREIIYTWAPPFENNTAAYMNAVAQSMGVSSEAVLSRGSWPGLIKAIIKHENGQQPYLDSTIIAGINAA